eukprot:scaffold292503_cov48-Prasinocladus_malaysianus.AAC.4
MPRTDAQCSQGLRVLPSAPKKLFFPHPASFCRAQPECDTPSVLGTPVAPALPGRLSDLFVDSGWLYIPVRPCQRSRQSVPGPSCMQHE